MGVQAMARRPDLHRLSTTHPTVPVARKVAGRRWEEEDVLERMPGGL